VYDDSARKILAVNADTYNVVDFLLSVKGSDRSAKTLRTNIDEKVLLINNNDERIVVGYLKAKEGVFDLMYIERGRGGEIVDFAPLTHGR